MSQLRPAPTRTRLADGRELLYFDDAPGRTNDAVDRRELPPRADASEIRWDPLGREWAVIADQRQGRTYRPATSDCPLCPSRDGVLTEIPARDYDVVVFENRFPSLSERTAERVAQHDDPLHRSGPALGRCEVVVFTSDHDASVAALPPARMRTVIDAWAHRTAELRTLPSVGAVFCFENRGDEIGVTLAHPHGQIYAYPFVPPRLERAAHSAAEHAASTGRCLQCDLLASELDAGERVVVADGDWVGYVPFAARWPYEVRIAPRRHVGSIDELTDTERDGLAEVYLDVLGRFDRLFDTPAPYIAGWDQAPNGPLGADWHLAAEVFTIRRAPGKLKYLAGSESGAAVWINDVTPERAATALRAAGRAGSDGTDGREVAGPAVRP